MSVTTKRGDEGQTDLLFEERIDKDDLRIEIFGCLDGGNVVLLGTGPFPAIPTTSQIAIAGRTAGNNATFLQKQDQHQLFD